MSYLNSVTIVGFVGADPEQRQARNNGSITRAIPAVNSGLRRPVSAASNASRLTAAKRTLIVEGANPSLDRGT